MSFAVYGVNKVKCKDQAFRFIADTEKRSIAVIETEIGRGGRMGLHFKNYLEGIENKDDYELALKEKAASLEASANWTCISPKYDAPCAAVEYLEMLKSEGGKGCIKQQVGCVDGTGEAVFTKLGKKQKLEWLLFDTQSMKVVRK